MEYGDRRARLHRALGSEDGVILMLGAQAQPRNYPDNPHMPFRQNSHFLYYTGIQSPGFAYLSHPDGREVLFGPESDLDTLIWTGPSPSLESYAASAQFGRCQPIGSLASAISQSEVPLYLKPFQADMTLSLARYLRCRPHEVFLDASQALTEAVVRQREIKSDEEIAQIEEALGVTQELFHGAMARTRPGVTAASLLGYFSQQVCERRRDFAFPPIISCRGEILHNHHYDEVLEAGRMLLVDMGTEGPNHYTSDITRTWPVSGSFSPQQRAIYEVVLAGQAAAIDMMAPGVPFREVHLRAAETMTRGLIDLGLMRGDPTQAVKEGAYALFFPHGLGHMMGLDVHDMEDLGDVVGYGDGKRSEQFGLNFLRLSRPLQAGHVVTVEPGLYFIPTLIDLWRQEGRHEHFVCYEEVESFRDFGGIRIEDDVVIEAQGARILGPPIAKSCEQVEGQIGA